MPTARQVRSNLVQGILGFFGTLFGILVLPKLFKFAARRAVFGFVAEVVMIALAGLLTEKAAEMIDREKG